MILDLGPPFFFPETDFIDVLSPHCPKINKKSLREVRKLQDFCPLDFESCHLVTARRV